MELKQLFADALPQETRDVIRRLHGRIAVQKQQIDTYRRQLTDPVYLKAALAEIGETLETR